MKKLKLNLDEMKVDSFEIEYSGRNKEDSIFDYITETTKDATLQITVCGGCEY